MPTPNAPEIIALADGLLHLVPTFYDRQTADELLHQLLTTVAWEQHLVKMFGREIPAPRRSAWYGDPGAVYRYSGVTHSPHPWLPALTRIRLDLAAAGYAFNSVLLNHYRDGRDAMGWHSDDEPELGPAPLIASLSFGGVRRFVLRHRQRPDLQQTLSLAHGSLLLMLPPTQANWRHRLPATRQQVAPRVNLTFRCVL